MRCPRKDERRFSYSPAEWDLSEKLSRVMEYKASSNSSFLNSGDEIHDLHTLKETQLLFPCPPPHTTSFPCRVSSSWRSSGLLSVTHTHAHTPPVPHGPVLSRVVPDKAQCRGGERLIPPHLNTTGHLPEDGLGTDDPNNVLGPFV